jgi:hypothetical protein
MTNRKLAILGIVAVCTAILAVVVSRSKPKVKLGEPAYLIQGLNPARIGRIVLGTGEDQVTLKLAGRSFVVTNKDNYPANISELNNLITSCLGIQTGELVTDDADNHKDLGVTKEDAGSIVEFWTPEPNSTLITGVVVGKYREQGEGTYVRLASSNSVYSTPEAPWIRTRAMDYIDQKLILAKRDDIESVTVGLSDTEYTLKAKEDGQGVELENVPESKQLKDSEAKSVLHALTDLRFTDVKNRSTQSDLTFDKQYLCRLKDSTEYRLKIAQKDNKSYVMCEAEFTDKTPVTVSREAESEEELKKKEAKLLARDKAEEFTKKHQGWIYEIADWKAKDLTKALSDLLEDVKQEKAEQTKQDVKKSQEEPGEQKAEQKTEEKQKDKSEPEEVQKADEPNATKLEA